MNDTEHVKERLTPGKDYTRAITTDLPVSQVDTIGEAATTTRELLQKLMEDDGHEVLGYELVVRIKVRAGEVDGEGDNRG